MNEKSYFKVNRPDDVLLFLFRHRRRRINTQKMGLFAFRECEPAHRRIMNASTFLPILIFFNLCTLHESLNYTKLNANVPGN